MRVPLHFFDIIAFVPAAPIAAVAVIGARCSCRAAVTAPITLDPAIATASARALPISSVGIISYTAADFFPVAS